MNYDEIISSVLPRIQKLDGKKAPWSPQVGAAALADLASLPGRAYASLGRPQGESYLDALGRTGPTLADPSSRLYQGEGDELSEAILRDPTLPLGVGLGRIASGLGKVGRVALDALGNAGMSAGSQYATDGRVDPRAVAIAAGLGAAPHAISRKAPVSRMASEISPAEGRVSYRFTSKDSPMSDWGHAMFADNRESVLGGYGKNEYHVPINQLTDVRDIEDAIRSAWDSRDLSRTMNVGEARYYDGLTSDEIIDNLVNVDDIVNTAKGYDSPLVSWLYEAVIEPNDIKGLKTLDGAIVFDPDIIKSATGNRGTFDPNDPNITHLTAPKTSRRAMTPTQALGSQLTPRAQAAFYRKYLAGDDRGDTPYTKARR